MGIMGRETTKILGGKGGKGLFTEAEDGKQFKGENRKNNSELLRYCGGGGRGNGYFRGGLGEYGVSEWAGGGGVSNYCKAVYCYYYNYFYKSYEKTEINDYSDYAGVITYKYEYKI